MRRRLAVIAAAVVPVVALVVAIAITRGDSSSQPAKLPVAFGNGGRGTTAAALDAAEPMPSMAPYAPIHYVAASHLPDLGGSARAYRVVGAVTDAAIASLARALGVDPSAISVQRDSGQWSTPAVAGDVAVTSPCSAAPDDTTSSCVASPPPTTTPPPPSLSEADAKTRAADIARAAGVDVDAAAVDAQLQGNQWYVTIDPTIDGLATSGVGTTVAFGADGDVAYANGFIVRIDAADEYPLRTTRQAIDDLNANQVVPLLAPEVAPATDTTPTTVVQRDVTVTDATRALLYQPTYDGRSGFLLPAYRFSTDDGQSPTALAIDRSWFAPPPVATTPEPGASKSDGATGSAIPPAPASPPDHP